MSTAVTLPDLLGHWLMIFITISIFSYLYADNPFYKLAEHLFVGTSVGYVIVLQYFEVLKPNLIDRLMNPALGPARAVYIIPLLLVLFLFARLVPRFGWLSRIPVAFVIGFYAGQNIPAYINSDLIQQVHSTLNSVASAASGDATIWQIIGSAVLVFGMLSALTYFIFSRRETGPLSYVSRVGVWVLMIGFGASFGYTVQGRLSLAIGRVLEVFAMDKPAAVAAQLHGKEVFAVMIAVIFAVVFVLERRRKRMEGAPPPPPDDGPPKSHRGLAIFAALFGFLPFGIIAVRFATQVNSKLAGGDREGAARSSQLAKTWSQLALLVGLLFLGLYVLIRLAIP